MFAIECKDVNKSFKEGSFWVKNKKVTDNKRTLKNV